MMDWGAVEKDVRELGAKIDFKPDCIVGIARGGVIPAVMLSYMLGVSNFFMIKIERDGSKRHIRADAGTSVGGKRILIVEDMLETGDTLSLAKKYFELLGSDVRTACLYIMDKTTEKPDFFLRKVEVVIRFPWE